LAVCGHCGRRFSFTVAQDGAAGNAPADQAEAGRRTRGRGTWWRRW
jgi:hypothetical protein